MEALLRVEARLGAAEPTRSQRGLLDKTQRSMTASMSESSLSQARRAAHGAALSHRASSMPPSHHIFLIQQERILPNAGLSKISRTRLYTPPVPIDRAASQTVTSTVFPSPLAMSFSKLQACGSCSSLVSAHGLRPSFDDLDPAGSGMADLFDESLESEVQALLSLSLS